MYPMGMLRQLDSLSQAFYYAQGTYTNNRIELLFCQLQTALFDADNRDSGACHGSS